MKHPQYQRHHNYSVEWLQAVFTLMILVWIYLSLPYFEADSNIISAGEDRVIQSTWYWNESLWYGFQSGSWYVYHRAPHTIGDRVEVKKDKEIIYDDPSVRVSFYTGSDIEEVQKYHTDTLPRAYSRLPNGIAVIEGDLASAVAKTIIATLYSR